MILLLHNKDLLINKFSAYLAKENIPYINIDTNKFVNSASLELNLTNQKISSRWQLDENLDLNTVSAVYHNLEYPAKDVFKDFIDEDINYCRSEWFAYLMYELSYHPNCVNPVSPVGYFNPRYNLPSLYAHSKKIGFQVPEYFLFPKKSDLSAISKAIALSSQFTILAITQYTITSLKCRK